jgi:hypothetical protein
MGLAKKRLYKPERRPARKRGVLDKQAPVSCPDATKTEIALALFAIAKEAGVIIGQGGSYDPLRDEYVCVGKVLDGGSLDGVYTGRVQDVTIHGAEVGAVIMFCRQVNGGPLLRDHEKMARRVTRRVVA